MNYKVTVNVMTQYSTIIEADSEEKAIELALEREGPAVPAYLEDTQEDEWAADILWEFPNLAKDEIPNVEEID